MDTIPKILLDMFEHESAQARFVLAAAKDIDLSFTPKDEMRPLIDLTNHLAQIPIIDFRFFTKEFESFEQVRAMEKDLRQDTIENMLTTYDQGIESIEEHISKLSDEAVLENQSSVYGLLAACCDARTQSLVDGQRCTGLHRIEQSGNHAKDG